MVTAVQILDRESKIFLGTLSSPTSLKFISSITHARKHRREEEEGRGRQREREERKRERESGKERSTNTLTYKHTGEICEMKDPVFALVLFQLFG